MNFTFEINEPVLIYHALFGEHSNNFSATRLKNRLYKKYYQGYRLFLNPLQIFSQNNFPKNFINSSEELVSLFEEIKNTKEYQQLLASTQEYKNWLQKIWKQHEENVKSILCDITRVDLPTYTLTVYIINPLLCSGSYLGEKKIIWGHTEDWPHYNLVYLTHEYLHSIFDLNDLEHAIIELVADNELRLRLNKKGEYFFENNTYIGHVFLADIVNKLLPLWKNYLGSKNQNIFTFIKTLRKKQFRLT